MPVKKFLFDLGNVFFDWNPNLIFKKVIPDEERLDYFLKEISFPHLDTRCDIGVSIKEAVKDACEKFPDFKSEIEVYYDYHRQMVNGSFQQSIDIFYKLKSLGYPCFVLSNWSAETYEGMEDDYPFLKDFDGKIISGRDRLIKPDPQIYQLAISRFNLVPSETVFIDDRADNIETAVQLGFHTIHLTDPSKIAELIESYL
jgi:FMN phosphatase YigB (HAD superfamily)